MELILDTTAFEAAIAKVNQIAARYSPETRSYITRLWLDGSPVDIEQTQLIAVVEELKPEPKPDWALEGF